MGETIVFIIGMAVGCVVLLAGIFVGSRLKQGEVVKPPKPPKLPKKTKSEPMPLYADPFDNALHGKFESRIPTVEDK